MRAYSSQAPNYLRIGLRTNRLLNFQKQPFPNWGDKIFSDFSSIFTQTQLVQMKKNTWKILTFLLHSKFSSSPGERTELWSVETKQARPHLYFAPKIIRIRSLALENEFIEHAQLVSKKCQKQECVKSLMCGHMHGVTPPRACIRSYIIDFTHSCFCYFF